MGGRSMSPGGTLLRTSRMFSVPKPLPEPHSTNLHIGDHKSSTMTRQYPQHQSITSPLSSREKGDWGYKRPFPLKSTMATSTPLIRIKQVDSVENVTDFASAADHSLSLEKFQELRVALSVPRAKERDSDNSRKNDDLWHKSVFEEHMDFTDRQGGQADEKRWKFQGPWLARMTEGDFIEYLGKKVHPKRAQFRALLRARLATDITTLRNKLAMEKGEPAPPKVEPADISNEDFTEYMRSLRNDRVTLYHLVSKFLDLAPLGRPIGFVASAFTNSPGTGNPVLSSPYGISGPPPSHPSAGISYLRTSSFMENHPVYGPQSRRTPAQARVISPRQAGSAPKLGVGGFVAAVPAGDNEFNIRYPRGKTAAKKILNGVAHLDTTTYGGAKAFVEPRTASIDPSGRVVLEVGETSWEAQVIARENKGLTVNYYEARAKEGFQMGDSAKTGRDTEGSRLDRISNEILGGQTPKAP